MRLGLVCKKWRPNSTRLAQPVRRHMLGASALSMQASAAYKNESSGASKTLTAHSPHTGRDHHDDYP